MSPIPRIPQTLALFSLFCASLAFAQTQAPSPSFSIKRINGWVASATLNSEGKSRVILNLADMTEEEQALFPEVFYAFIQTPELRHRKSSDLVKSALSLLENHASFGKWIYDQGDSDTFSFFLGTDTDQEGNLKIDDIDSAVHETAHGISTVINGMALFPLIDQRLLPFPELGKPYREVALEGLSEKEKEDNYAVSYLTGNSGAQGLHKLLDELNAYAVGNRVTVSLAEARSHQEVFNPGLLRMQRYLAVFLSVVKKAEPETYSMYKANTQIKEGILTLWRQAESVATLGCLSKFAHASRSDIEQAYQDTQALTDLYDDLERFEVPPACSQSQ